MSYKNPTAYWGCDETSGTRFCTTSLSAAFTESSGTVPSTTGIIDKAIDFVNADASHLVLSQPDELHIGDQDFSVQIWIKVDPSYYQDMWIISAWGSPAAWGLQWIDAESCVRFLWHDGENLMTVDSETGLSVSTWYCIHAGHRQGHGLFVRVNAGQEEFVPHVDGGNDSKPSSLIVGDAPFGGFEFLGLVDEIGIWVGYALTESDCEELYNDGSPSAYPWESAIPWDVQPTVDLRGMWHLGESGSNVRVDSWLASHLHAAGSTIGSASGLGGLDAASFTRSSEDHLWIPSNPALQAGDTSFTFFCVFKRASTGGTHVIASKDGGTREWLFSIGGTNLITAQVFKPSTVTVSASSFGATTTGVWYAGAIVHNATTDKLAVFASDGTTHDYSDTDTGGALQAAGTAQFRIGSSELVPTAAFDGLIQEALWWKRAVSEDDLVRLATLILDFSPASLFWHDWYRAGPGRAAKVLNGGFLSRGLLG